MIICSKEIDILLKETYETFIIQHSIPSSYLLYADGAGYQTTVKDIKWCNKDDSIKMGYCMKKQTIAIWVFLIGMIITLVFIINPLKKDIWDVNAAKLKNSVDNMNGLTVIKDFSKWTPFEWDVLYSFTPYTTKDRIYEVVGYKWDPINETVNDNMNQIVFLKEGKVICYLYGYPESTNFSYRFGDYEGEYIKFDSQQKLSFNVKIGKDGIRYFDYIKND